MKPPGDSTPTTPTTPTAPAPTDHVRLIDIAAAAGVSVGTVSKALNNTGQLRESTRQRVVEASARLGFQANARARDAAPTRSFTVGLISNDEEGRFMLPLLIGAENELSAENLAVFLCDSHNDPIREQHYVNSLLARRVDGFIFMDCEATPRPALTLPVPAVYAFSPATDDREISVVCDQASGVRAVMKHVASLGRRRIAHVTGPAGHHSAALRAALMESEFSELLVAPAFHGEWSESWGRASVPLLRAQYPEVDAIVCGNDHVARGVTDALREAGVVVPRDIVVTGFDNHELVCLNARPPLTSVDMEFTHIGATAARLLIGAIEHWERHGISASDRHVHRGRTACEVPLGTTLVQPRLVIRGSSIE
ncbi:LacI family DNA-binding transcriptional regulator [Micrococcales bacterium 31B]|nr:LacI family DNA-binding transcriptional regulator [Micrococcales bacterium 31B]